MTASWKCAGIVNAVCGLLCPFPQRSKASLAITHLREDFDAEIMTELLILQDISQASISRSIAR
jgi:hypothetical protein